MGTAQSVDLLAAADQGEGAGERLLNLREDNGGGGEHTLGLAKLLGDAFLLLAAEIFGDGAGDDATSQPAALLLQLGHATTGVGDLRFGLALLLGQLSAEALADGLLEVFRESDGGVVPLNGALHVFGREVGQLAVRPALVAAEAEEVEVLALGLGEAEAAATGAEDAGFEVVAVGALAFARFVVHAEDLLNAVEQGLWDEGLVAAVVLDALEDDLPQVVAVGEQVGDVRGLHGAGQLLAVG